MGGTIPAGLLYSGAIGPALPAPITMDTTPGPKPPFAWQPITGPGVAAFAAARTGRLFVVQFVVALFAAAAVLWFLVHAWFPVVRQAIHRLPEQGAIRHGQLEWQGDSPQMLADGTFLGFSVDLSHEGRARSPAHVQVEFGRTSVRVFSLFGFYEAKYVPGYAVAFNRPELEPWWGAWSPIILALVALSVISGLMLTWLLLATIYCLPAWLVAFYADRQLTLAGSWRLAGAALMPGALFQSVALIVYGLGGWDLIKLTIAFVAHLVIGWLYVGLSPLSLPRRAEHVAAKANPFAPPK
jgi:hypothetical protein